MGEVKLKTIDIARMSAISSSAIEWLWKGRVALGKVTVIAGEPGLGKSLLTAFIAAAVTNYVPWPDGEKARSTGQVIFLSAEDDPSDTIKPRLIAAGADTDKCHILKCIKEQDDNDKEVVRFFNLAEDVDSLSAEIGKIGNVRAIIIDPVSAYLSDKDSNNNSAIRGLLLPLEDLARTLNVAIILVTHFNKSSDQSIIGRVIGSIGMVAAARAAYAVVKDETNSDLRYFLPIKNNIGNDYNGFAFHVETAHLLDEFLETSKVIWHPEAVNAKQIFSNTKEPTSGSNGAKTFLKELLAQGSLPCVKVFDEAEGAGYSRSSIQRAAKALGVTRAKMGMEGGWTWTLPKEANTSPQSDMREQMKRLGEDTEDDEDVPF